MTERDFAIAATETTFVVGRAHTVVAANAGTMEHELVIEPRGAVDHALEAGGRAGETDNIAPGQSKPLTWTFTVPGAHQFACHKPEPYEQGMVLSIDVVP